MEELEIIRKFHNGSVRENYVQVMLEFKDYLMLFGDNKLMYYNNLLSLDDNTQEYTNVYLEDDRRLTLPYSSIPEHIERVSLIKKNMFANQILEFNKPYIAVSDGIINKITTYKENDSTYIHFSYLSNRFAIKNKLIVNRQQLENYYNTGTLNNNDNNHYINKYIFLTSGRIINKPLKSEDELVEIVKQQLIEEIKESDDLSFIAQLNLLKVINDMKDIAPLIFVLDYYMIKMKENNEIVIDNFIVKYLEKDKYEVIIYKIPVNIETLESIKERFELSKVKQLKAPKIDLSLNPQVTQQQLEIEKTLFKRKKSLGRTLPRL